MTLQEQLADPACGEATELAASDRLLILFASKLGGLVAGVPPWNFARSTEGTDAARVFLRDPLQQWYQRGTPEHPSVTALAGYLGSVASQYPRSRLFGASMGGYAALQFGRALGLDAYVVNPQTFIAPALRARFDDHRWDADLAPLDMDVPADAVLDLRDVPYAGGRQVVVYAAGSGIDRVHAEWVRRLPGIELDARASNKHDLAKYLAASGELARAVAA